MPYLCKEVPEVGPHLPSFLVTLSLLSVHEVASFPEGTVTILEEGDALLGLVEAVLLVILPQFVGAMCKFALVAVGTKSK